MTQLKVIQRKKHLKMGQSMILVKLTKPIKLTFRHIVVNEKFNSILMNFQKKRWLVSGFNVDQHYACLKKVLMQSTSRCLTDYPKNLLNPRMSSSTSQQSVPMRFCQR